MDPVIRPARELCVGSKDCLAVSCPSGGDLLGVVRRVSPAEGQTAGGPSAVCRKRRRDRRSELQGARHGSRCAQSLISQVRRQQPREEQELAQGHTARLGLATRALASHMQYWSA